VADPRRIVILNWRDITHPRAGGAERVTHEIARRWVAWGHQVTLFCASYQGAPSEDVLDGVRVIRRGRQQTVHWEAYRHYRRRLRGRYHVIIDEVNTMPFFAPLYASEPVIMFSHQLAREVWRYEAPFPLSAAGYVAEPLYLQAYRRTPIITVSPSTRDGLRELGLPGPYHVIPEAVDTRAPKALPSLDTKESPLTLAFVGRVVASKRVDHIVRALELIHHSGRTDAHLWIIGAWDERCYRRLSRLVAALGLGESVAFFGRVDDVTKEKLLARAHVLVMTSVREGWGLVVSEANALGTPAVVYDVPGLRDSTRDGQTGLVCRLNTPSALAQAILSLQAQPLLYARLREQAWVSVQELSWDRTAHAAWAAVEACL
jgi:glycosyltransferase involved in cell wall biosynthesis